MPEDRSVTHPFVFQGIIGYYHFNPDTIVLTIAHVSLDDVLVLISAESDLGTVNVLYDHLNYNQLDAAADVVRDACRLAKFGPPTDDEIPF